MSSRCSRESATHVFEIFQGSKSTFMLEVLQDDGITPKNINGWTFKMGIKLNPMSEDSDEQAIIAFQKNLNNADEVLGKTYLSFEHKDTADLYPTTYFFDLKAEYDGVPFHVLTGKLKVLGTVTQGVG